MSDADRNLPGRREEDDEQDEQDPFAPEGQVVMREMMAVWAGPMPPPAALAQLDAVVPGLAREVADEFRAEAKHRRLLEKLNAALQIAGMILGYACAGLFAAGCIALIWHAIDKDNTPVATTLAGGALIGGILAFLRDKKNRSTKEDE